MPANLRSSDFMEHAMHAWGSTVYRLALSHTQSSHDADDVCQDVFLRLLKDATTFKDDEHLKAWLLCVTVNRCRDLHRSAWKRHVETTNEIEVLSDIDTRSSTGTTLRKSIAPIPMPYVHRRLPSTGTICRPKFPSRFPYRNCSPSPNWPKQPSLHMRPRLSNPTIHPHDP